MTNVSQTKLRKRLKFMGEQKSNYYMLGKKSIVIFTKIQITFDTNK